MKKDKMYKLTILAKTEMEAKDAAIKEGARHIIKIDEIKKVYHVVIIR